MKKYQELPKTRKKIVFGLAAVLVAAPLFMFIFILLPIYSCVGPDALSSSCSEEALQQKENLVRIISGIMFAAIAALVLILVVEGKNHLKKKP